MSAPERIWLTDREIYGRGKPPEQWANPDKGALATAYILVTAHEAAVAAARERERAIWVSAIENYFDATAVMDVENHAAAIRAEASE